MSHFMYGRKYVPFYVLVENMSVEKTSQNASRVVTYDRKFFFKIGHNVTFKVLKKLP